MLANARPKPIKRRTAKAQRRKIKAANIMAVRDLVEVRDGEQCRVGAVLRRFGYQSSAYGIEGRLELAHVRARGLGGNPDLSRDTTENTLLMAARLHRGQWSHHSGHLKIEALTDSGTNGPIAITFYEKLPSEL